MKVLLLLGKGFEHMETGVFIDVMGWARHHFGLDIEVVTCGYQREVTSTFGVPLVVDKLIGEVAAKDYDALAIPGGFEDFGFFTEAHDEPFLQLIRDFDAQKKPIASICVAALALGKSGILKGRRATTYHVNDSPRIKALAGYGADIVHEQMVVDGNVITSCGPSSAVGVAFRLLEMLTSKEQTQQVMEAMGY
ncbi:DJ-1/PfpI family protein [Clostridia bacterium OttesenSCG-928-O13]|nr:DJ-1/PfpI family protein [Clostridia bacterium OttesenSCG-928-O13]